MKMRCPFRYRSKWKRFGFGVDPEFMDYVEALDASNEIAFNNLYPTCWIKFLHWLGLK